MVLWLFSLARHQAGSTNLSPRLNLYPVSQLSATRESHINTEIGASVSWQSLSLNDAHPPLIACCSYQFSCLLASLSIINNLYVLYASNHTTFLLILSREPCFWPHREHRSPKRTTLSKSTSALLLSFPPSIGPWEPGFDRLLGSTNYRAHALSHCSVLFFSCQLRDLYPQFFLYLLSSGLFVLGFKYAQVSPSH